MTQSKPIAGLNYPDEQAFRQIIERIKLATNTTTERAMFSALGLQPSSVHNALKKHQVQPAWIIETVARYGASAKWLIFGDENAKKADEVQILPIVEPRLTGDNELEVGRVTGWFPFPADWLEPKGKIENLLLIRLNNDAMEPTISDKSLALINTALNRPHPGSIFAIAFNGGLHLKRLHIAPDALTLQSDNKRYPDITVDFVAGRLAPTVKIIGRAVCWWHEESI